jgi:hypothetical protein
MTMAENVPDQTPATPPVDYRPQPRYGELAPEGWTWTPPQDENAPAAAAALPPAPTPATPGSVEGPVSAAPGWDRPVTSILLVLGLLGTYIIASMLISLPEAMQTLYTQAGLGSYTAAESVGVIISGGSIGQVIVWLATAVTSVMLMIRHRRAFYVPLIGGVVSFVLLVAAMAVVLAGDTALLDYFGQP